MIYVVFRFLKRRKTWSVIALLFFAVWLGISRFNHNNDVVLYNREGGEISFLTSVKSWLRGDFEGGITLVNVRHPKLNRPNHSTSMAPLKSVVADFHHYDPDLKLIFHESVDQRAQIALFWNESKRLAALYTFPETLVYAEHETSAPNLKTALSSLEAEIEAGIRMYFYDPDKGISSFQKRITKINSRIEGANIATFDTKHGPLESWGFGTDLDLDDGARLKFFIGYDKSEKRWRTYEFRVQHAEYRSRRDWEMQEFRSR